MIAPKYPGVSQRAFGMLTSVQPEFTSQDTGNMLDIMGGGMNDVPDTPGARQDMADTVRARGSIDPVDVGIDALIQGAFGRAAGVAGRGIRAARRAASQAHLPPMPPMGPSRTVDSAVRSALPRDTLVETGQTAAALPRTQVGNATAALPSVRSGTLPPTTAVSPRPVGDVTDTLGRMDSGLREQRGIYGLRQVMNEPAYPQGNRTVMDYPERVRRQMVHDEMVQASRMAPPDTMSDLPPMPPRGPDLPEKDWYKSLRELLENERKTVGGRRGR